VPEKPFEPERPGQTATNWTRLRSYFRLNAYGRGPLPCSDVSFA
jgi:hypothetical protein